MILTQRERQIAIALGALIVLVAAFFGVIKPNIDGRAAVAGEIDHARLEEQQNNTVLAEKAKLLRVYNKMITDGLGDSEADAREQIREALNQWAQACHVSVNNLSDAAATHNGDFNQITFKLSGLGSTKNIAMLLNECEITTLPLRVTKFTPSPSLKEGVDYLKFDLTLTTLYIGDNASGAARAKPPGLGKTYAESDTVKPTNVSTTLPDQLADPYKVLLDRSIFSRDNRAAPDKPPRVAQRYSPPTTTQSTTAPVAVTAPDPEANYVLRGVVIQDGVFTASFEQISENKGISRRIGESIARGKIATMSLDGVDYALNGKSSHILIGQDLTGRALESAHSTASAPATGGGDWRGRWHHAAETPATPPAPASPAPSAPTTNPADPNQKSADGPPGGPPGPPPDDDSDGF